MGLMLRRPHALIEYSINYSDNHVSVDWGKVAFVEVVVAAEAEVEAAAVVVEEVEPRRPTYWYLTAIIITNLFILSARQTFSCIFSKCMCHTSLNVQRYSTIILSSTPAISDEQILDKASNYFDILELSNPTWQSSGPTIRMRSRDLWMRNLWLHEDNM
ncbi:hypothetical protein C8J56DRAFT_883808 [Mycena floridula]|nr:hypothetical protein C8J56DRAFT_883808 [Mycena floridula]